MATGPFDILSQQELRGILRRQRERGQKRKDEQWRLAADMLADDQKTRTEAELKLRFPKRQAGARGDRIPAFILPLATRYADEAANLYNHSVQRELVDENGNRQDKQTDELNRLCTDLDEQLHTLERRTVVQDAGAILCQAKRGKLDVQHLPLPQIFPVLPEDAVGLNAADQLDYHGHVLELDDADEKGERKRYVFVTPAAHYSFEGKSWDEPGNYDVWKNDVYHWPQSERTEDGIESVADHPLQLITWWHKRLPETLLLPVSDVPVAVLNLELNIQMSCLLDTMRKQGFSQWVAHLMNPEKLPQIMTLGSGFIIPLALDESLDSVSATNDYVGMTEALQFVVRFFALLLRQSPNDFSIEGQAQLSGFAKLVDSLPKIEARQERGKRMKAIEEQILWPRLGAIGMHLGAFTGDVTKLRMRVTFGDLELPQATDERISEEEHDIKHGFTTEAKLLAHREGTTLQDAEAQLRKNRGESEDEEQPTDATAQANDPMAKFEAEGLNGIQITSFTSVLEKVATGLLPRDEMVRFLEEAFPMMRGKVDEIMGSIGKGFEPKGISKETEGAKEKLAAEASADPDAEAKPKATAPGQAPSPTGPSVRDQVAQLVAQRRSKREAPPDA